MFEKNIILDESTKFSFECKLCGNCCKQMLIRLTPFDIINLAYCLNLPTYDFISDYVLFLKPPNTSWLLAALKHVKNGECMFKRGRKCRVHINRPLPCRLFPLGRKDRGFILHKTNYCKGHNSNKHYSLEEWLIESEAKAYLEMSHEFYEVMKRISSIYRLDKLDTKNSKMLYKILYDYDSASLESTISLKNPQHKARFCLKMAEWFLSYIKDKENIINDVEFLAAYEKQALIEEKKIINL